MFTLFCVGHAIVVGTAVGLAVVGPKTLSDWLVLIGFIGAALMAVPLGWQYIQQKVDREMEAE